MNMAGAPAMSPRHFERLLPYAVALDLESPGAARSDLACGGSGGGDGAGGGLAPGWYRGDRSGAWMSATGWRIWPFAGRQFHERPAPAEKLLLGLFWGGRLFGGWRRRRGWRRLVGPARPAPIALIDICRPRHEAEHSGGGSRREFHSATGNACPDPVARRHEPEPDDPPPRRHAPAPARWRDAGSGPARNRPPFRSRHRDADLVPPVVRGDQAAAYRDRILKALPEGMAFSAPYDALPDRGDGPRRRGRRPCFGPGEGGEALSGGRHDQFAIGRHGLSQRPSCAGKDGRDRPAALRPWRGHGPCRRHFRPRGGLHRPRARSDPPRDAGAARGDGHITTEEGVAYAGAGDATLGATINHPPSDHHRNHILAGGIRPHYYCLPVAKREKHRLALRRAATSGSPRFFLGTDSAPHADHLKEQACGCAGCFTATNTLSILAHVFEEEARSTGWRHHIAERRPLLCPCPLRGPHHPDEGRPPSPTPRRSRRARARSRSLTRALHCTGASRIDLHLGPNTPAGGSRPRP